MKKSLLGLVAVVVAVAFSQGCNTVKGLGNDIETVGEKSQQALDSSTKPSN